MANKVESPTSKDSKLAGSDLGVEISWLPEQIKAVTAGWGGAIARFYPQFLEYWESGARNYELVQNSYLEPLKKIRWAEIISKPEMKVLDVGAGSGWLSAFLSRFEEVSKIDALDADQKNLNKLLPEMFKVMDGDLSKVTPVLGLFEPILQPDAHYDLIVASSSIHHASNLFSVMRELKRVLKPDGKIVILNEIPRNKEFYLNYLMTMTANVFRSGVALRSSEFEASFSANGILYDPGLGDFALGYHHYDNAICTAGLDYKVISTGCIVTGFEIKHFVCWPDATSRPLSEDRSKLAARGIGIEEYDGVDSLTTQRIRQIVGITAEGANYLEQLQDIEQRHVALCERHDLLQAQTRGFLANFLSRANRMLNRFRKQLGLSST